MLIEELKELKNRIIENSGQLKKHYPLSENVLDSLNSLLSSYPCNIRIELWVSSMEEFIDEIIECLEKIESQDECR